MYPPVSGHPKLTSQPPLILAWPNLPLFDTSQRISMPILFMQTTES